MSVQEKDGRTAPAVAPPDQTSLDRQGLQREPMKYLVFDMHWMSAHFSSLWQISWKEAELPAGQSALSFGDRFQCVAQFLNTARLRQERGSRRIVKQWALIHSRGKNDADLRPSPANLPTEFLTGHVRQPEIGNDNIDAALFEKNQCVFGRPGLQHVAIEFGQHVGARHSDQIIAFDQQDAALGLPCRLPFFHQRHRPTFYDLDLHAIIQDVADFSGELLAAIGL